MHKGSISIRNKLNAEIVAVPDGLATKHLPGLDGLRGLAILLVILGHMLSITPLGPLYVGSIGVDIFFVISGFLITTLLLKEQLTSGRISLRYFYIRRMLRIMPVAYLFILVLFLLDHHYHLNITGKSFLTAALYLKNIPFKNAGDWYTGHFWSLSVEEQYYLIFPALLVYLPKRYIFIVTGAILLIPVVMFLGYKDIDHFQANQIIHLITFMIINVFGKGTVLILTGSAVSFLTFKKLLVVEEFRSNYWLSFVLLTAGIALEIYLPDPYFCPILFALIISFIILNSLSQKTFLLRILETRLLVYIGTISYSLYIWQQLFSSSRPWGNEFPLANSPIVNLIALFIVSTASYYLYERFFLKLKRYFK